MTLSVLTATIAAGQSLSPALDVGLGDLVRFYMPAAWTPANLTFQLSPDNVAFSDLFAAQGGAEFTISVVANAVYVTGLQWRAMTWIRFRSGTRSTPVVQAADRIFKLAILR